jgi:hypothetical protein
MPGIPDDQLDVLLLALAHGVKAIETGYNICPRQNGT